MDKTLTGTAAIDFNEEVDGTGNGTESLTLSGAGTKGVQQSGRHGIEQGVNLINVTRHDGDQEHADLGGFTVKTVGTYATHVTQTAGSTGRGAQSRSEQGRVGL